MEEVCPDAWFLNYTNPMAMLTGAMLRYTNVKTVGLCHSVQVCAPTLMKHAQMEYDDSIQWKIAGINHMAWLLEISKDGKDLYPEIKQKVAQITEKHGDMVRLEMMKRFGYYVTESSEHNAEYLPFFIKDKYPELIDRFNIPLDEYPRRCVAQIAAWEKRRDELTKDPHLTHTRTHEYASYIMVNALNRNINESRATITKYLGVEQRKDALRGADFVVNAIQVGLYEPCTVIDFEVPKKFGLRQTIADTLGIGGIFRGLRTIPVMMDFARDMEEVCPNAWFLNYTNPMCMLSGAMQRYTNIKTVGLCHSVQVCAKSLMEAVGMEYTDDVRWKIAGINHMAWLLEITRKGVDLYPEIKERFANMTEEDRKDHKNLVRLEIMKRFGYYVTESSEHNAEYMPYFIKDKYPELIERFNIPLDEYPRRCVNQIEKWKTLSKELTQDPHLSHERTHEYASYIMEAIVTDKPYQIGGNVLNNGLITNLPRNACVEVPCLVDHNGVQPTYIGDLPEPRAFL